MKTYVGGRSFLGLPQVVHEFQHGERNVLILGGVHGDENEGVAAADAILTTLIENNPFKLNITIVPRFNPDGALFLTRQNGNGVDLNRNLPTKDWSPVAAKPHYFPGKAPASESENRFLIELIEKGAVDFILTLHSWKPMLNINGPSDDVAAVIAKHTGYRIDPDIGYPTPGSLGTYAGLERNIPTLTYEIERGLGVVDILKVHVPAIFEGLKVLERK